MSRRLVFLLFSHFFTFSSFTIFTLAVYNRICIIRTSAIWLARNQFTQWCKVLWNHVSIRNRYRLSRGQGNPELVSESVGTVVAPTSPHIAMQVRRGEPARAGPGCGSVTRPLRNGTYSSPSDETSERPLGLAPEDLHGLFPLWQLPGQSLERFTSPRDL